MSYDTEKSSTNVKFFRSDLNFHGFSKESLHVVCKYGLLVNTEYPKLVLALIESPEIYGWLHSKIQDPSILYSQIFQFIEKYSAGKPFLHLETQEFWDNLVSHFMSQSPSGTSALDDFEAKVSNKIKNIIDSGNQMESKGDDQLEADQIEVKDVEMKVVDKSDLKLTERSDDKTRPQKSGTRKKKQQRNFWI